MFYTLRSECSRVRWLFVSHRLLLMCRNIGHYLCQYYLQLCVHRELDWLGYREMCLEGSNNFVVTNQISRLMLCNLQLKSNRKKAELTKWEKSFEKRNKGVIELPLHFLQAMRNVFFFMIMWTGYKIMCTVWVFSHQILVWRKNVVTVIYEKNVPVSNSCCHKQLFPRDSGDTVKQLPIVECQMCRHVLIKAAVTLFGV